MRTVEQDVRAAGRRIQLYRNLPGHGVASLYPATIDARRSAACPGVLTWMGGRDPTSTTPVLYRYAQALIGYGLFQVLLMIRLLSQDY